MPNLSREYYESLLEFSPALKTITQKLATDKIIIDKIKDNLTESTPYDSIVYFVFYDLCQLLKLLSNGNINAMSLETMGTVMLLTRISPDAEDFFALGYLKLAFGYKTGKFKESAQSLIDISGNKNPLGLGLERKSSTGEPFTTEVQSSLGLPAFLKINNHSLFEEYVTTLYRYAAIISKADGTVTKDEEETLKKIYQITHYPLPEEISKSLRTSVANEKESLDDVLKELEGLIGLNAVKQEVKTLTNYIKIQKEREKTGLKIPKVSYHCVFTGSPGTGKTTIARIVARIYRNLGILLKGHLVETDRSGLVAEYLGQTAVKVNKAVDSALDGVLFIDEAYALIGEDKDDFGKEAVATLIKRIEDDRERLAAILAGYTEEMKKFINVNPGLRSRFNRYIEFADYSPGELIAIFDLQCNKLDYKLTDNAREKISEVIAAAYANRDRTFGNGRYVRNIFEKTIERQANRIAGLASLTKDILTTITADDIPDR